MNDKNLENKIKEEMERQVDETGSVSPVSLLIALKYLDAMKVEEWKEGKIPNLERGITLGREKVLRLLSVMSQHAKKMGYKRKVESYVGKDGKALNFSVTANPVIEEHYSTLYFDKFWGKR